MSKSTDMVYQCAFAEDADVGGEAAVGEGESADQPSPATVIEEITAEAPQGGYPDGVRTI